MRDFLIQQFKDLYRLTGLRQYLDLTSNAESKEAAQEHLNELLEPMLEACQDFAYIPEAEQKKIIRRGIMVTDRQYFYHLDAYWIRRWLQAGAGKYFKEEAHKPVEIHPDAISIEEFANRHKDLFNEWQANLMGESKFKMPKVRQEDIDAIKAIDAMKEGEQAEPVKTNPKLVELHEKKMEAIRSRGLDKLDLRDLKKFEIEGIVIHARTETEAQEIYLEVYA